MSSSFPDLFGMYFPAFPPLLVYIGGIIVAALNRSRYPTPSLYVLIGCVVLLAVSVIQPALTRVMLQWGMDSGNMASRSVALLAVNLVLGIVRAGGFALLIAAAFARREPAPASPYPPTFPS